MLLNKYQKKKLQLIGIIASEYISYSPIVCPLHIVISNSKFKLNRPSHSKDVHKIL